MTTYYNYIALIIVVYVLLFLIFSILVATAIPEYTSKA